MASGCFKNGGPVLVVIVVLFAIVSSLFSCGFSVPEWRYESSVWAGDLMEEGDNDGPLLEARFSVQMGDIAIFSDIVMLDDSQNNRIVRIAEDIVTTFHRYPEDPTFEIGGIVLDDTGRLFISVPQQHVIFEIFDGDSREVFAGKFGIAGYSDADRFAALFDLPDGLAWEMYEPSDRRILIADSQNHCIRCIYIESNHVSTVAGRCQEAGGDDGAANLARFKEPHGVWALNHEIWVADTGNNAIRKIAADGTVSTINAGSSERPYRISVTDESRIYVVLQETAQSIFRLYYSPEIQDYVVAAGPVGPENPKSLAVDTRDGSLKVVVQNRPYVALVQPKPWVEESHDSLSFIATTIQINGTNFSPICSQNIVTFNPEIGHDIIDCYATWINIQFHSILPEGNLAVSIAPECCPGLKSDETIVAEVVHAPEINPSPDYKFASNGVSINIYGSFGNSPENMIIELREPPGPEIWQCPIIGTGPDFVTCQIPEITLDPGSQLEARATQFRGQTQFIVIAQIVSPPFITSSNAILTVPDEWSALDLQIHGHDFSITPLQNEVSVGYTEVDAVPCAITQGNETDLWCSISDHSLHFSNGPLFAVVFAHSGRSEFKQIGTIEIFVPVVVSSSSSSSTSSSSSDTSSSASSSSSSSGDASSESSADLSSEDATSSETSATSESSEMSSSETSSSETSTISESSEKSSSEAGSPSTSSSEMRSSEPSALSESSKSSATSESSEMSSSETSSSETSTISESSEKSSSEAGSSSTFSSEKRSSEPSANSGSPGTGSSETSANPGLTSSSAASGSVIHSVASHSSQPSQPHSTASSSGDHQRQDSSSESNPFELGLGAIIGGASLGMFLLLLVLLLIVIVVIIVVVYFACVSSRKNKSDSGESSMCLQEDNVSIEIPETSRSPAVSSSDMLSTTSLTTSAPPPLPPPQSEAPGILHTVHDIVEKHPLSQTEKSLSDQALASISSGTPIPGSLFASATWAVWVKISAHLISASAAHGCELILAIWGSMGSMSERLELLRTTPILQLLQSALHATSKDEKPAWGIIDHVQGDFYQHITDPNDRPKVIEDLGNGAFGWVRKAEWTRGEGPSEIVAVKQITYKKKFLGDASSTTYTTSFTKIQREVLLMSILSMAAPSEISHLIAFRGHYLEQYSVCIMMQCALGSLKEFLEERRFRRKQRGNSVQTPKQAQGEEPLRLKVEGDDLALKIGIASQVASGLLFLHSVGIVHRDLKNENVLIVTRPENGVPNVVLTDFGLSRAASASSTMVGGTISWASPELLDADEIREEGTEHKTIIAASSDVYSFGYLLWALLLEREPHGRYLLSKKKIKEMVLANPDCPLEIPELESDPNSTTSETTRAAERYTHLILECWRMKPEDRPSMAAVLEELQTLTSQISK